MLWVQEAAGASARHHVPRGVLHASHTSTLIESMSTLLRCGFSVQLLPISYSEAIISLVPAICIPAFYLQ